ncbi:hypothetical protein NDU88_000990 [Pleurodeles waltl]|uniref:Secreted protein n=1 Tax=Pleurodeles waltl TaxID=8319 RepID=A0AAV7SBM3_PLEWA|nr:hypothetical protein NDU88_000990 [Pleurodeles waltl]
MFTGRVVVKKLVALAAAATPVEDTCVPPCQLTGRREDQLVGSSLAGIVSPGLEFRRAGTAGLSPVLRHPAWRTTTAERPRELPRDSIGDTQWHSLKDGEHSD